jgi:predicted  nucleic acid-binding Zn-ribbon protein
MSDNSDPSRHQRFERQFVSHVERLLDDDRLRLPTTRGRRSAVTLIRDVQVKDRGVELKRLMSEMGKPDRELESRMPVGKSIDVAMSVKKWWFFKTPVGRFRMICVSPSRALLAGEAPLPMSPADVTKALGDVPPPLAGEPITVVLMSTSGFTQQARDAALRIKDRTLILASPNETGGWTVIAGPDAQISSDLFDPEADTEKRSRIRAEIESHRVDLASAGLAADKLAAQLRLPTQLVESELKSYAKENAGLAAKRIDGRFVLFREGSAPLAAAGSGGIAMPLSDKIKSLFARKGEVEKKVAFLSERRTALNQQLERGYEEMGAMESKEGDLRKQFKETGGDLTRRRITTQLLQLRKEIERRQQLLSVLNQQINVVSTHLHNLELQRQGKAANLPDSEEIAADAAAAEEVLAELQAGSELAESVGATVHGGMNAEEQALYEELLKETKPSEAAAPEAAKNAKAAPQAAAPPPIPQRKRNEPEPG